jgi:uncharacterized protein YbjT (DUF2867 family)
MILLTGATGKTGAVAARLIAEQGVPARALARNAAKAESLAAAGIELVVGDVSEPASLRTAMQGIDRALLILNNTRDQLAMERQFVDIAKECGVKHLVKMSSMEAAADAKSPIPQTHWAVEQYIKQSGLSWTMIKPNFFMQNLLGNAATIKSMHKFFLPMGSGTTAMSDTRDIGAATAAVMTGTGHENQTYELTGPELLSFHDVADRFTEVLGTKVEYVDQPMESYRETLAQFLPDEWHLNAVCDLFAEIAEGGLGYTTDTLKALIGREPTSLAQFIKDHLAIFSGD